MIAHIVAMFAIQGSTGWILTKAAWKTPSKFTATWIRARPAFQPTHPAFLAKVGGALPGTNLCGSEPTSTGEHM